MDYSTRQPGKPSINTLSRAVDKGLVADAVAILNAGVSIVPVNHKTKAPLIDWKPYQHRPADEATAREWFKAGAKAFAVVGGAVSGGLVGIDFDDARFYPMWRAATGELSDDLPTQRSGREGGGYHVLFRCPSPIGNERLAFVADAAEESGRRIAIETRGEGGVLVASPSLHPSGRRYEMAEGSLTDIPSLTQEHADVLIAHARDLDECPVTRQQLDHAKESTQHKRSANGQAGVIDAYNDANPIDATLEGRGYLAVPDGRYKRPGGKSPSVFVKDGKSFHHSGNDPLNDGYWHRPFDVFCALDHGGDCKAAVKAAARMLGMDHPATPKAKSGEGSEAKIDAAIAPILTRLSDVRPQTVSWLWPDRIARGKITLGVGDPGLGKSFWTCDLTARVTMGTAWPDDVFDTNRPPGNVIILNAEDGLADTIVPRLIAAGADLSRVVALEGVSMYDAEAKTRRVHSFNLARDLPRLEQALEQHPLTELVIIDPVSAYLGKVDSHSNAEVRGLLAPLAALAERFNVAMVLISHMNKGGGSKSVYRVNGSLAFPAAARAAWLVAKDPIDPDRRLFLCVKNNLARDAGGLAFRLTDGRVVWEVGAVSTTADDVLGASEQPNKSETAEQWLSDYLAGGPKPVKDIESEAKEAGITIGTLRRAREALAIKPRKEGFGLGWCWSLASNLKPPIKQGEP